MTMLTMTRWQDQLAAKIKFIPEKDWESELIAFPAIMRNETGRPVAFLRRKAWFTVECEETYFTIPHPFIGKCVNQSFGKFAPGHVMLTGIDIKYGQKAKLTFELSDRPWNTFLTLDGTWKELRDDQGELRFPIVDFDAIK